MPKKPAAADVSKSPSDDLIVNVRLTGEDAAKVRAGAEKEARTVANFARLVMLVGVAAYDNGQPLLKPQAH